MANPFSRIMAVLNASLKMIAYPVELVLITYIPSRKASSPPDPPLPTAVGSGKKTGKSRPSRFPGQNMA
jgi:hypothetical protein